MDELYINIANFKIKIALTNKENKKTKIEMIDNFKNDLTLYLKPFIITKPSRYDFKIDVSPEYKLHEILKIDSNKAYVLAFRTSSTSKITTFYQLGIYEFEYILQGVISHLLNKKNGLSIHGSAVLRGGKADLFVGQSGAGKSTISNILAKNYPKLSDDASYVNWNGKDFYFHNGPEVGKKWNLKPDRYLLGNIYFLKKSKTFKIRKIDKNLAFQLLLSSAISTSKTAVKKQMDFIAKFNNMYYLYFPNDKSILNEYEKLKNNPIQD